MHADRLEQVLRGMADRKLPQLIVAAPPAIFYLTGKWIAPGERMLALYLSLTEGPKLFVNELFAVPEELGVEKIWFTDTHDAAAVLAGHLRRDQPLGIDKDWPARFLLRLMALRAATGFVEASGILDRLRMRKDAREQALMREASRLNDLAMDRLIALLRSRPSEKRLARHVAEIYEEVGADGVSFEPIVAYGANAAEGHHAPQDTLLHPGDCVVLDIGCKKHRYCSDMTRTVFYQRAPEEASEVYRIVRDAQARAIAATRPGARFCDIDAAARSYIEAAGHGKAFTHRTGHSIGLEVHDFGDVSATNTDPVLPGMIFSIEPSIKLPGRLGIRIEDLVLVTDAGCEVLNTYGKELRIVE